MPYFVHRIGKDKTFSKPKVLHVYLASKTEDIFNSTQTYTVRGRVATGLKNYYARHPPPQKETHTYVLIPMPNVMVLGGRVLGS